MPQVIVRNQGYGQEPLKPLIEIEILHDEEAEEWVARCVVHFGIYPARCSWEERYFSLNDAIEYCMDHFGRAR